MRDVSWWKEGVIYQIYPKSFCDSNGDGIGDLQGIISKLDYISWLGANIIWLCPIYPSPGFDDGYDISDYLGIRKEFGTLADFDELLREAHRRGIRVVLDLVVNHTSSEHPWFKESRSSRDADKRDYYIWRDGSGGKEPNNWDSAFGGPAWQYDGETGQYYLHCFAPEQPDLNWNNPKVRDEVVSIVETWFSRGIDGFRMDVIDMISKMDGLPDLPAGPDGRASCLAGTCGGPHVHEYIKELHDRAFSLHDCVAIGECPGATAQNARLYVGKGRGELDMLFQFEHLELDHDDAMGKWTGKRMPLPDLKECLARWQRSLHDVGWNALYWCNHDQPRIVSRMGSEDPRYRGLSAKCLATALHFLQGTPCVFQGEEIGMANYPFTQVEQLRDVESLNAYSSFAEGGMEPEDAMRLVSPKCRDNARTPMQWDGTAQAGFTAGQSWMAVNPDYREVNVADQRGRDDSVLAYYRQLIALRRFSEYRRIIADGDFNLLCPDDDRVFAYLRRGHGKTLLVACNVSLHPASLQVPSELRGRSGETVVSNYQETGGIDVPGTMELRPFEATVLCL